MTKRTIAVMLAAVCCLTMAQPAAGGGRATYVRTDGTTAGLDDIFGIPHDSEVNIEPFGTYSRKDLSYVEMPYADLSHVAMHQVNLSGSILFGADLFHAYLGEADLSGAGMPEAALVYTYLSGADLSPVNLSRAYLYGTSLIGADLGGSVLTDAEFFNVDLRETLNLSSTIGSAFYDADTLFATTGDYAFDPVAAGWVMVPEPATMSLLAMGGLAVLRKRRK